MKVNAPSLQKLLARGKDLARKFDTLSLRDRLIVFLVLLLIIYGIFYFLVQSPLNKKNSQLKTQMQVTKQQMQLFQSKIELMTSKVIGKKALTERQKLSTELKALEKHINVFSDEMVPTKKMAEVLHELFVKEKGLELTSARNLPDKPLIQDGNLIGQTKSGLYEKGLELTFTGDFFSTLNFLKRVEALKWKVFWTSLEYNVAQYPKAEISVKLYTLGGESEE